jgi:short-subunit dehydrogenase
MKFDGKVALVTGASSGIGRAIALEFGKEGAHVAALARTTERLDSLADELRAQGVRVLSIPCDVTDRTALRAAIDRTAAEFGRLDILVNNAGIGIYSPVATVPVEDFERVMELNFWATLCAIQTAIPHFEKQQGGIIINVSSILGKLDFPWMGAYCASKHAVNSISNALRMELKEKNVEVLTVCPGRVLTNFQPNAVKYKPIHNPRWSGPGLTPEQVAHAVVRGAWKHKREIVLPRMAWVLVVLQNVWPTLADRLAMAFSSR